MTSAGAPKPRATASGPRRRKPPATRRPPPALRPASRSMSRRRNRRRLDRARSPGRKSRWMSDPKELAKKVEELLQVYESQYPGDSPEKLHAYRTAAETYLKLRQPAKAAPIF